MVNIGCFNLMNHQNVGFAIINHAPNNWIIQPGINKPLGCLIGKVLFKYQIVTLGGIPP